MLSPIAKPDLSAVLGFQKHGIAFLTHNGRVILGDDTGLGKSLQCILAAEALRYTRLLIFCPLIGLVAWRHELRKWSLTTRAFHPFNKKDTSIPPGPLVYLVPYSSLSAKPLREQIRKLVQRASPFDVAICDEGHYLANPQSQRTVAVYGKWCNFTDGLIDKAHVKSIWILSGTIQRRDVRDLYPHLKAVFPDAINTALHRPKNTPVLKRDYDGRYLLWTYDGFGLKPQGNNPATIPELRAAIKPFVLARRKADVAPELGTVRQFDLPLGMDPDDPYAPQVQHPEFGRALIEELFSATSLHTALALTETAAEERRVLGMIKVRPVTAWVEDWFENADENAKLVIFAWHRDVIREMEERLQKFNPVIIMGGLKDHDREAAVDLFQNDPACRVFIGQTVAASTSVTLTASSTVLTMEPDWIPANDYQSVSRVHRIGQSEPVFNYRAFIAGTIDSRILTRANARLRDFDQLMDGLITNGEDHAHPRHA